MSDKKQKIKDEEIVIEDNQEDDIELELDDDALVNTSADTSKQVDKIKKKLKKAEQDKKYYLENWQKAQADFVNARKFDTADKERAISFATRKLIEDIIPVVDSFDVALQTIEDEGMKRVYQQLTKALLNAGVEQFDATGETFDPAKHEAMSTEAGEENTVIKTLQKGYIQNGEVIRTAKVVVGE